MPQHRPPGTLKQQCIRNIARNMDKLWARDYVQNWHEQSKTLSFVLGPFEDLPGTVVELLIEELVNTKRLRKHHLQILLVYHLERFVLRKETDFEKAITLLLSRCKNLRHIGLRSSSLPCRLLTKVFMSLEHLQTVDLSQTSISEVTLATMGENCKNVRILNLSDSSATDKGIAGLIHGHHCPPTRDPFETTALSRKLIHLNVYGSHVTSSGVLAALVYMPSLQELNHSELLASIARLSSSDLELHLFKEYRKIGLDENPVLNLRRLQCDEYGFNMSGICCDASLISFGVTMCPLVHSINFGDLISVRSESLLPLLQLNEIDDLTLYFEEKEEVDFYEHILPLLLKFGPGLRKLHLRSVHKVNLKVIGCLCNELQLLRLMSNCYYCDRNPGEAFSSLSKVQPSFQHLKIISVDNEVGGNLHEHMKAQIPVDSIRLLLQSPCLEEISLIDQDGLTDEVLMACARETKLPKLKEVQFVVCNNLTVTSIWEVMHLKNPMSTLRLIDCKQITVNDYKDLTTYVKRNKFALDVLWS
ncbi:uncharacterized protein LOC135201085 [Macrobrachium nipponense]|uniref:uncharacterized protein LOC135201085 n=1 Tax=Macrobrachium nipponense TaxID=159736 RepID=UPI0030C7D9DB